MRSAPAGLRLGRWTQCSPEPGSPDPENPDPVKPALGNPTSGPEGAAAPGHRSHRGEPAGHRRRERGGAGGKYVHERPWVRTFRLKVRALSHARRTRTEVRPDQGPSRCSPGRGQWPARFLGDRWPSPRKANNAIRYSALRDPTGQGRSTRRRCQCSTRNVPRIGRVPS